MLPGRGADVLAAAIAFNQTHTNPVKREIFQNKRFRWPQQALLWTRWYMNASESCSDQPKPILY
ncbi:MAG: hypothetical protein OHK0046_48410 [Anaerolineae bacterium]